MLFYSQLQNPTIPLEELQSPLSNENKTNNISEYLGQVLILAWLKSYTPGALSPEVSPRK